MSLRGRACEEPRAGLLLGWRARWESTSLMLRTFPKRRRSSLVAHKRRGRLVPLAVLVTLFSSAYGAIAGTNSRRGRRAGGSKIGCASVESPNQRRARWKKHFCDDLLH